MVHRRELRRTVRRRADDQEGGRKRLIRWPFDPAAKIRSRGKGRPAVDPVMDGPN
jgi:hypothetical protein